MTTTPEEAFGTSDVDAWGQMLAQSLLRHHESVKQWLRENELLEDFRRAIGAWEDDNLSTTPRSGNSMPSDSDRIAAEELFKVCASYGVISFLVEEELVVRLETRARGAVRTSRKSAAVDYRQVARAFA